MDFNNIFTHRCGVCGKDLLGSPYKTICGNCAASMEPLPYPYLDRCKICGDVIFAPDALCLDCTRNPPLFINVRSLFDYHDRTARFLVRELKFRKNQLAAQDIAQLASQAIRPWIDQTPGSQIIPVPGSFLSRLTRGYNQVELLLKHLHIPYERALSRVSTIIHQKDLSAELRKQFIKGQFRIKKHGQNIIKGRDILIFDDIMTTGNTLREVSRVLMESGAHSVKVFTFFRD